MIEKPHHVGHWYAAIRTACAVCQVILTGLVALKVFGIL